MKIVFKVLTSPLLLVMMLLIGIPAIGFGKGRHVDRFLEWWFG